MKILVLADIDTLRWKWETGRADAVLSCGDVADRVILEAAEAYRTSVIFAVKGNHDISAPFPPPIVDLHLRVETFGGLKFGGFQGCWQYKPRGHFLYTDPEVHALLADFPAVDVFAAHNSPLGIHDKDDGVHRGFEALIAYLEVRVPAWLIHGHQHRNCETRVHGTTVIGVVGHRLLELPSQGS